MASSQLSSRWTRTGTRFSKTHRTGSELHSVMLRSSYGTKPMSSMPDSRLTTFCMSLKMESSSTNAYKKIMRSSVYICSARRISQLSSSQREKRRGFSNRTREDACVIPWHQPNRIAPWHRLKSLRRRCVSPKLIHWPQNSWRRPKSLKRIS